MFWRLTDDRWEVSNSKGEKLTIWIDEILEDVTHELGDDPGLVKDGVEAHLQELLAASPETLEEGLVLIRREYPTDIGPVDLLCADVNSRTVAVEIKRRGEIDGVEQLSRYIERLNNDPRLAPRAGHSRRAVGCASEPESWQRPGESRRSKSTTTD